MTAKASKPKETAKSPAKNYPEREARKRFERAVDIGIATKPVHKEAKKPNKKATMT
jgi:hypothetical protein